MNIETKSKGNRALAWVLGVGFGLLAGCDLPPGEPGEHVAGQAVAFHQPPPCPGGRPVAVHDATWRCDPSGSWQLETLEEWVCTDAERRRLTRVVRPREIRAGGACSFEPPAP